MTRTALLIANPTAKRGEASVRRVVDKLTSRYTEQGWQVVGKYTERHGPRERQIVDLHGDSADSIIAIGGDGTVRETVLAMSDAQRARIHIGFVPMGNANVLAREVGIPIANEEQAIEQVFAGHARLMDVGAVDGKPTFLLMLDVGYFAQVVHAVAASRRSRATNWMYSTSGDLLYAGIGLLKLLTPNRAKVTVTIDEQSPFTTTSIAIANASKYAKSGSLCPDADPSDGVLNFNAVRPGKTLRYAFAAMRGQPKEAVSRLGKATRFSLRSDDKRCVCQVDGDPLSCGPFEELTVEVLPNYYSLIAPRPERPSGVIQTDGVLSASHRRRSQGGSPQAYLSIC